MKKILFSCLLSLLMFTVSASAQESAASFDMDKVSRFGFGNILLGGWTPQDGWVSAEQLQNGERFQPLHIWGGEQCRVFGLDGLKGEGVISALHSDHPGEVPGAMPGVPSFDTHTPEGVIKAPSGLLTILCPWDVQPRKATVMKTGNATYQGIVKRFLAAQGLNVETPKLAQLFKIDLEGDGVDEVLICAQNIAGRNEASFEPDLPLITEAGVPQAAQPGAYSLLLLRKIVAGKVLELPLHAFVSPLGSAPVDDDWTPPVIAKLCQFADLNGDGVLEIIAATAHYEGHAYHAFEVKGGEVREVLTMGIGN
ncbi:MAG: hypothetical protein IJZ18_00420 [Mailhella sp.]|nr:hypothetical protein [Mailhella sp.]